MKEVHAKQVILDVADYQSLLKENRKLKETIKSKGFLVITWHPANFNNFGSFDAEEYVGRGRYEEIKNGELHLANQQIAELRRKVYDLENKLAPKPKEPKKSIWQRYKDWRNL